MKKTSIRHIKNNQAFTLMEVLVALFIFSILSILTMRGLQSVLTAKQKAQKTLDLVAELEIAYSIIQQDIEQIINRTAKDTEGGIKLAFISPVDNQASKGELAGAVTEDGYNRLEFTRAGVSTSLISYRTCDLQRVAYYHNKDKMLVRHSWRQVDPSKDTLVDKRRLIANVENLEIFFIDAYGRESEKWEVRQAKQTFGYMVASVEQPRGIRINFDIKDYGNIEWVFSLPQVLNS